MIISVAADQVSLILDSLYNILISLYVLAYQKKGGVNTAFFQAVQKFWRIDRVRAVVKGQGNLGMFLI